MFRGKVAPVREGAISIAPPIGYNNSNETTAMKVLTYNVHLWEGRDGRMDIERGHHHRKQRGRYRFAERGVASCADPLGASRPLAELASCCAWIGPSARATASCRCRVGGNPVGNAVLSRFPVVDDANHDPARLPLT